MSEKKLITGDQDAFQSNWVSRTETDYIHWSRNDPQNQIQLAFRSHWDLFKEIMDGEIHGKKALEVGCGRGSMSAYFADNGFDCTLLDYSEPVIKTAKRIFEKNNLTAKFDVGDAMNLPYEENAFDVVFSIGLFEHFEDIAKPLKEQIRVLSNGGLFLAYVVPEYKENIQKDYSWVNDLLKELVNQETKDDVQNKAVIFRSDDSSEKYRKILSTLPVNRINSSGVYPLPMISHSIDFPFTLLNPACEHILVSRFKEVLEERYKETGKNPWLCEEGYGQAYLVWCFKN